MELAFKNARIVTPDESFIGSLQVRDGKISAIDRGPGQVGEDLDGDVLMPGVIDLHTDSLEKHYYPRANIDWSPTSAAVTHDGCGLSVGVTTVFNSLSVGSFNASPSRKQDRLQKLVDGIQSAHAGGMLKADHRIHWRCETTSDLLPELLEDFSDHPMTSMFSMMDHTPGQRQYRNISRHMENWRANGMSQEDCDARLADYRERQARNADRNREFVAKLAVSLGQPLASHDDEDVDQIDTAADLGATVAEFPVTLEAAERARERGMVVVMGGPNLIRGGSYSGNVRAAELAEAGLLDAFASDYVPRSLIECAFALTAAPFSWPLHKAAAVVTAAPARAAALDDRGEIALGKRADLIRVRLTGGLPILQGAWVEGRRGA